MKTWERNLAAIWLAQFFSIMGFTFAIPFNAFFFQKLGVTDPKELATWVAVFAGATPLTLAIFAPIWGHLADRYGRRLMMLRAYSAGFVVLLFMGLAQTPLQLVILRLLQGVFTGTVTAAQTMVAVSAPRHKSGTALGILSTSLFSGAMAGGAVGGPFADMFGYRNAFFCSSACVLIAGLLVLFGSTENFNRKEQHEARKRDMEGDGLRKVVRGGAFALLLLIGAMSAIRMFDFPFVSLVVQELNHGLLEGSATKTGLLMAVGAVAGMLSGFMMGRLSDKVYPPVIAVICAAGAGILMIPQGLANSFMALVATRAGMTLFAGGMDPVFQIWLAKITPEHKRGVVFGWATSAKCIGWVIAPMFANMIVRGFGLRQIFFMKGILYILLIPFIGLVVKGWRREGKGENIE